jgi:hypothetical protein
MSKRNIVHVEIPAADNVLALCASMNPKFDV